VGERSFRANVEAVEMRKFYDFELYIYREVSGFIIRKGCLGYKIQIEDSFEKKIGCARAS